MKGKLHFDWSDLKFLIHDGLTLREIGRIKGCSHDSVRKAINRMNIDYKYDKIAVANRIAEEMDYKAKFSGEKVLRIIVICDYCNKKYEKLPSVLRGEHHFCSNHCKAKWIGRWASQDLDYKQKHREIALASGTKPPLKIGADHWNWQGGIADGNRKERGSGEYAKWKNAVFAKDNYTCQICDIRGGNLSAHHLKEWAKYPESRYDVNNGQCLCYDCHMELHGLKKKTA